MSLSEANELKIMVKTLHQMIDMLHVFEKEFFCNQCIVSADTLYIYSLKDFAPNILLLCLLKI